MKILSKHEVMAIISFFIETKYQAKKQLDELEDLKDNQTYTCSKRHLNDLIKDKKAMIKELEGIIKEKKKELKEYE